MPLLKKSFKGNLSQTKNITYKGFKTPLSHQSNIRDIIDFKLSQPSPKKNYKGLESKYLNKSSSPKEVLTKIDENEKNRKSKTQKRRKSDVMLEKDISEILSFSPTDDSLSQEELNRGEVKAAYIEFMNNSLTVPKTKNNKKKVLIYSSSEELLDNLLKTASKNKENVFPRTPSKDSLKKNKNALTKNISWENEDGFGKKRKNSEKTKITISENASDELNVSEGKKTRSKGASKQNDKKSNKTVDRTIAKKNSSSKVTKEKTVKRKKSLNKDKKAESKISDSEEFPGLSLEEKMDKIYEMRNVGLYVLCDRCNKARYLPHIVDPLDLPDKWFCRLNPDRDHNKCSDPEHIMEDEDFLVDNLYNAGSVVFAKVDGHPWWPAMVEDDPDLESYFWLEKDDKEPDYYHVTFFDSAAVSRAWIRTARLNGFKRNIHRQEFQVPQKGKNRARLVVAWEQATDALGMPLIDRLKKYGFVKRHKRPAVKRPRSSGKVGGKNGREPSKKRRLSVFDEEDGDPSDVSAILGDVSLSDLSFNFLD